MDCQLLSGSAGGASIERSWPYYQQMLYPALFMKHRTMKGNYTVLDQALVFTQSSELTIVEEEIVAFSVESFSPCEVGPVQDAVFPMTFCSQISRPEKYYRTWKLTQGFAFLSKYK